MTSQKQTTEEAREDTKRKSETEHSSGKHKNNKKVQIQKGPDPTYPRNISGARSSSNPIVPDGNTHKKKENTRR